MKKFLWAFTGLFLAAASQAQTLADLHARDINSDGVTDAYYDSFLDITWMADANYHLTSGAPREVDYVATPAYGRTIYAGDPESVFALGSTQQPTAQRWADDLSFMGYDDWRLPERFYPTLDDCVSGRDPCGGQAEIRPSELTVMATRLAGSTGPFQNVRTDGVYFTYDDSIQPAYLGQSNWFGMVNLLTGENGVYNAGEAYGFAWAVRDGDIAAAPVPEPSTYALMLLGLGAVGFARARRKKQ